ncbi:AMP-binding protein [Nocardioides sp.]|uniref:AMP-binding protein n=1 Tax=Nocardioides sp. TaxID=35761 RepID=UPI003D0B0EA7
MELTWFRKPSSDQPGTLNLCYNALDRHVIRGRALEPAVITPAGTDDFATVLEHVAALAGALRALGVGPGAAVGIDLEDPADALLAFLACARLGAVPGGAGAPAVLLTSREPGASSASVSVLRGIPVTDVARQVDWDLAIKAGRDEPAPCADVSPRDPAWSSPEEKVLVGEAVGHGSPQGQVLARLCAGEPVGLN